MNDAFRVVGRYTIDTGDAEENINRINDSASESEGILGKVSNGIATFGKVMIGAIATASTAIGVYVKQSVDAYGEYEQLVGGVETLFGESSNKLMEYANKAYATAGLSANQYMEQATAFSASLLQSLSGDTDKAVEYSNMAITDMSDNANKMGTNIQMIQNAYQGFAKQNYMMLDNLKLGYGGTKTEMERLLADANEINRQQGIMTDYSIENLNDVIEAIHVVQQNIGITGTTALEASGTITGSMSAVRASWENLLVAMADESQDVGEILDILGQNIITMLGNLMPRFETIFSKIPQFIEDLAPILVQAIGDLLPGLINGATALITGVINAIPQFIQLLVKAIPTIIQGFKDMFTSVKEQALPMLTDLASSFVEKIPEFMDSFVQICDSIAQTITDNFPQVLENLITGLDDLVNLIGENLPKFIEGGITILQGIAQGIADSLPMLIETIPQLVSDIANLINDNAPTILQSGIQIIWTLVEGIISAIPTLIENIPQIITAILDVWEAFDWINLGTQLVTNIGNGILSMGEWIKTTASKIRDNIGNVIAELPSKLFTTGKNAITYLGNGISSLLLWVTSKGREIATSVFNTVKDNLSMQKLMEIGSNMVKGIWNGISSVYDWIMSKISGFAGAILNGIKGIFGIHSPSTVFRDEVGKNLALGIGEGFTDSMDKVTDDMTNAIPTSFDINSALATDINPLEVTGKAIDTTNSINYNDILLGIYNALNELVSKQNNMQLVLDSGVLVGSVIDDIDSRLGDINDWKGRGF